MIKTGVFHLPGAMLDLIISGGTMVYEKHGSVDVFKIQGKGSR